MSELALELIAKEKIERTGKLDLGKCGLSEIPEEVFELTWLEELRLSNHRGQTEIYPINKSSNNGVNNVFKMQMLPGNMRKLLRLKVFIFGGEYNDWKSIEKADILQELSSLRTLDLSSNRIRDYSFLSGLNSLRSLYLSYDEIIYTSFLSNLIGLRDLDLSSNEISDVSSLSSLIGLRSLDISYNRINDVSFLSELRNLQSLSLSFNLITDISFLSKLTYLQTLYISANQITDIGSLAKLTSLQNLYLNQNQITDLRFLSKLICLRELDLRANRITDITELKLLIKSGLSINMDEFGGGGLMLFNNPITTPPIEIVKQGNGAVLDYFESIEKSKKAGQENLRLNEVKIILVGEGMAGKTSMLKLLKGEKYDEKESQTHGINIDKLELSKLPIFEEYEGLKGVTAHVWDFGGQDIMHASHQIFMTQRSVYIFLLDSRTDARKDYWLRHIQTYGDGSPAVLAINKADLNPGYDLERKSLNKKYPFLGNRFHRVSCKNELGVDDLKRELARLIPLTELFLTEISPAWMSVKNALEEATHEKRYIDEKAFHKICGEHGIVKKRPRTTLLKFLHDLGLVFHFERLQLADLYVLDPLWVTIGVYKIINSGRIQEGVLFASDLEYILNEEDIEGEVYEPADRIDHEYNKKEQSYLVAIMVEFELLYAMATDRYLIPDLLPPELDEQITPDENAIQFVLEYDFITQSIFNQLIIDRKDDVTDLKFLSRTQALFNNKTCGAKCLARFDSDTRIIWLHVWGDKKRECLAIFRDSMDRIHRKFGDLKVKRKLPVPGHEDLLVSYDELIGLERMGKTEYTIGLIGETFSVSNDFLDKVTTKQERMGNKANLSKEGDTHFHITQNNDQKVNQTQTNTQQVTISISIGEMKGELESAIEDIEDERVLLQRHLKNDEIDVTAKQLQRAEQALGEIEAAQKESKEVPAKSKNRLKRFMDDLKDEKSNLYKTLKVLKKGKDYGVNLARNYNKVAENIGMPLVSPLALGVIEKL